jgi:hypothetical protein
MAEILVRIKSLNLQAFFHSFHLDKSMAGTCEQGTSPPLGSNYKELEINRAVRLDIWIVPNLQMHLPEPL